MAPELGQELEEHWKFPTCGLAIGILFVCFSKVLQMILMGGQCREPVTYMLSFNPYYNLVLRGVLITPILP